MEVKDFGNSVEVEISHMITSPHGFSTRCGGVSEDIWEGLNLGMNRGDNPACVNENWRRFLTACGMPARGIVWGRQVHGTYVHVAGKEDVSPLGHSVPMREADGYVTKEPMVPLAVFTADCVPLLLEDQRHGVIGAVHSGWRGTVADIAREAVEKMLSLGAERKDIRVAIGPAIDSCCFEVGQEVIEGIDRLLGEKGRDYYWRQKDKYRLDLRGVLRERLLGLGILPGHMENVGGCTMCHPDRYWSHRYTKGQRGSQAAVIMLPEE